MQKLKSKVHLSQTPISPKESDTTYLQNTMTKFFISGLPLRLIMTVIALLGSRESYTIIVAQWGSWSYEFNLSFLQFSLAILLLKNLRKHANLEIE